MLNDKIVRRTLVSLVYAFLGSAFLVASAITFSDIQRVTDPITTFYGALIVGLIGLGCWTVSLLLIREAIRLSPGPQG